MRTFIALEMPKEVGLLVGALQGRLKAAGLKLRWVVPENIHLTLKFLGEIEPSAAEALGRAIGEAVRGTAPLALTVQGLGIFPNIRRPNVLWTGLGGEITQLQNLQSRLEEQLLLLGFEKEQRAFKAHLTLARIKDRMESRLLMQSIQEAGLFEPLPFTASEMILFRSDLRPRGAQYTSLSRARLAG